MRKTPCYRTAVSIKGLKVKAEAVSAGSRYSLGGFSGHAATRS